MQTERWFESDPDHRASRCELPVGMSISESVGDGDGRFDPTGRHVAAEKVRRERHASQRRLLNRLARTADDAIERGQTMLEKMLRPRFKLS
jgi:hypothetical protein